MFPKQFAIAVVANGKPIDNKVAENVVKLLLKVFFIGSSL